MAVDVIDLLRELGFSIAEGRSAGSWMLTSAVSAPIEVVPTAPVARLTAHDVRRETSRSQVQSRPLLIGESATPGVVRSALEGRADILTASPLRLIHAGRMHGSVEAPESSEAEGPRRRPAWTRWALERYLALSSEPISQVDIAASLSTTQQAISKAARRLGGLVEARTGGLTAADRGELLRHWLAEYPGPGGQEFGWYSLEPPRDQVSRAVDVAELLGSDPLVSGDVAADLLAPWKMPAAGYLYVSAPMDLEGDGFVPCPVEEATLVTCMPKDATLWPLAMSIGQKTVLPVADPGIVVWDLLHHPGLDNVEAAEHLLARLMKGLS